MAILLASVALAGTANAQVTEVELQTDKPSYVSGDTISISGTVSNVQAGTPLLLRVLNPLDALARTDQVTVAADGSWSYSFPSGGPLMTRSGDYTVIASYRGISEDVTFSFTSGEPECSFFQLSIEGKTYPICYVIAGGTVGGMAADVPTSTLTVDIASTGDGNLTIQLPRNVMQALSVSGPTGGNDINYEVFIDTVPQTIAPDRKTTEFRELVIPFDEGAAEIEIVGTWIIPEFGAIAAIVLAVAIVGIIITTTRYSKFSSFLSKH
jgi:predicted secreted protein with PEFG-CTERM motif